MVLRKLTMALLSVGVMLPGLTHALAVQSVKTQSALGEPFRAEVELSDTGDLTEEDIKVSLASPEDFQRLGIEQGSFLTELRFDVVMKNGRPSVKISSHKRVSEPFLDFVIRISWPNNTRLQEVTAFLDPPTMKSSQTETPAAPVVVQQEPVINTNVVAAALNVEPPPMEEEVVAVAEENVYQVRKNDTLWNVARRLRPNASISIPQMMKVLHQANPQAFIANNINMLKNGQVLRVPTLSDTQDIASPMTAEVNTRVVTPQTSAKPLARQQIDATSPAKATLAVQQAPRVQLKLIAPTGNMEAKAGGTSLKKSVDGQQTGGAGAGQVAKAATRHQKASKELAQLENQLRNNDRKIALQNARLAELEAQLKARRLSAEQAAKHKMSEKTALEKKALATVACAVATQSFLSTEAKAADAPAKEGGGSMAPIIGGGIFLVIIIAAIFLLKGKGKKPEAPKPVAPAPKPAAAAPQEAPKPVAPKPAPVEEKKPLDPMEEVKPYLEMERYPQAVGILSKALVQTPDRADLHLKLLEIFVKQKDRQAFEEQFAKLEILGELEAVVEAEKLKALLPPPPKPVTAKDDHIEFERVAKPAAPAADIPSLEDLEKDFAMSLSQPNLKALDIEIRPDPVKEPEPAAPAAPAQDMEALLDEGLEFSFSKEEAPVKVEDAGLEFKLDLPVADREDTVAAKEAFESGLSLDSLDDFLAEHKVTETPAVEEPKVELTPSVDFEKALAEFKEETQEPEPDLNLTEGFELEEFNLGHAETPAEPGLEGLDVDFSIDEAKAEFTAEEVPVPAAMESVDLSEAAAAFDQDLAQQSPEAVTDDLDLDFDLQVPSDDVLADLDKEFSFLASTDENATRLELARAYVDMGDRIGARDLLEEVIAEGNANQKNEAQGMLMRIG